MYALLAKDIHLHVIFRGTPKSGWVMLTETELVTVIATRHRHWAWKERERDALKCESSLLSPRAPNASINPSYNLEFKAGNIVGYCNKPLNFI